MQRAADLNVGTRQALRRLAKAVVVITTRHADQRFAMSATAISELSMRPPSMLVCINRAASIHSPMQAGAHSVSTSCMRPMSQSPERVAAP